MGQTESITMGILNIVAATFILVGLTFVGLTFAGLRTSLKKADAKINSHCIRTQTLVLGQRRFLVITTDAGGCAVAELEPQTGE